ncbi:ricin-type beta-trefoil lectin domain protein [Kitasatospora sp. NPDC057015]|uniref:ricin-type beta-trefoil lectin domain protein n=1 Tax=Kitasatospora sp. NPDC057015 TaxID=3346001 RepID=UPI0036328524
MAATAACTITALAASLLTPTSTSTAHAATTPGAPTGSPLAVTPPMGWNNWAHYGCAANNPYTGHVGPSEALFHTVADNLVSSGLATKGYTTVTVDDCWMARSRSADGQLAADTARFPGGMKALGDYFHARGLKFGIYQDSGFATCTGQPGSGASASSPDHYVVDANDFASWGVDYVKLDGCNQYVPSGRTKLQAYDAAYTAMAQAIAQTGRPMTYSVSEPAYFYIGQTNKSDWYASLATSKQIGQLWREGDDMAMWTSTASPGYANGFMNTNYQYNWPLARYSGPNSWNDPDFLLAGDAILTPEQQRTQVALWSMMAAPLIVSSDATKLIDPATVTILGNSAILGVDQDPLGAAATVVSRTATTDVLARPLANGDRAFAIYNRTGSAQNLSTTLTQVGYTATAPCNYSVKDLTAGTTTTAGATTAISASLPANGTAIYRVSSPYGCGTTSPSSQVTGAINSTSGCASVGDGTAGTPAGLAPCTGEAGQRFSLTGDGTIHNGSTCLAATGANGAAVKVATCSPGAAVQKWTYSATGNLVNSSNSLCLDVFGGVGGTTLDTWPCGNAQGNQQFQLPVSQATGELHVFTTAANQGTCLTVQNGATSNGTPVVSSACNGSASQNWTVPGDGTLRLAGKCLDDAASGGAGTLGILWPCTGNPNQAWTYTLAGNLISHVPGGLCLGIRGASTADGTPVELEGCGYNTANQIWTLPQ